MENLHLFAETSWQCTVDLAVNESVNETLYELVMLWPLFFFMVALCLAPWFLHRYKKRVTALMSTRTDNDTEQDRYYAQRLRASLEPPTKPGGESKDTLWPSATARLTRFDSHISRTVVLHLGLLMAVTVVGNVTEISGSLLDDSVGILAFVMFIGLLGTSMLESSARTKKLLMLTAALSLCLFAFALHLESKTEPESWEDGETHLVLGVIFVLLASLHAGLSGRQLRNVVPYLAVALTASSLVGYLAYRLYFFSTCILNGNASDTQKLIVATVGLFTGFLLAGRVIKRIANLYEQKRLSDRQIRVGCWLIFSSIVALSMLQVEDDDSVALKPMALLIPLVTVGSFWYYFRKTAEIKVNSSAQRLLLLRVFSSDKSGENWLSAVERFWRHLGPVYMIAGPDLTKSSIDPYELYLFLSRNIKSLFIRNDQQARNHLEDVDNDADPDGRYRINEFFCLDNTWEFVARGLIKQSDAIVLDLRGFEITRVGTAKEIDFLAHSNAFSRTLVLVDSESEIDNLIQTITQLTGLQIAPEQFVVATELSAQKTVIRLLELRDQNLERLYVTSEASYADYLTDENLQEARREESRRALVDAHEQSRYGIDYVVLTLGIVGLVFLWVQLLAALYLLARRVSFKRAMFMVLITYCTAVLTYIHGYYLEQFTADGVPQTYFMWLSIVLLALSVFLSIIWYYLSRRARRWIRESQDPLRTALKLQGAVH